MDQEARWLRLKEIYFAASALEGEARAKHLRDHCPEDLRQEVADLLEAGAATGTLQLDDPRGLLPGYSTRGLAPGSLLGHYRIIQKLGAGGMGWVYEAADEKLRRTVAIKVLPPGEIDDDRRKRFAREAQSASALNHPNIVTVYEVGREGDIDFISMERVSGDTLRHLINQKRLTVRDAIRYASQIADALAAAHEAGIVHRDLKPSNVMVTERGLVKVLDFGLAKAAMRGPSASRAAAPDTTLSGAGLIVGTVSYMSPEQAEGKPVDTRSDVFSFGSLIYEMLTGRRAFDEDSNIGTLAAILHQEPPIHDLPAGLPRGLDRILVKCLAKKPADRWQHLSDVKLQLDDLLREAETPATSVPALEAHRRFGWGILATAALCGAALAAALAWNLSGSRPAASAEPLLRMVTADTGLSSFPALSRDGRFLAFASDRSKEGNLDIWLQQTGGSDLIRLTRDPADETDPSFSPDGTRVAFRSEKDGGGVWVAPALGGEAPTMLAPAGRNPRFSPDGKLVAYWTGRESSFVAGASSLFTIEAGGGVPRPVHPELPAAFSPLWSPKGHELLVVSQGKEGRDWVVVPLAADAKVRPTGAMAVLRAQGLADVQLLSFFPTPLAWTAEGGDKVLFAAPLGDVVSLWEMDLPGGVAKGPARRVTRGPGRHARAAQSAGLSRSTAFGAEELNFDVWAIDVDPASGVAKSEPRRLTEDRSAEWAPSLSGDGRTMAYLSRRGANWMIRTRNLETGAETTLLTSGRINNVMLSADGSRVLFSNHPGYALFSMPRTGGAAEKLCERCGTLMGVSSDGTMATYEPLENEDLLVFEKGRSRKLAERPGAGVLLSRGRLSLDGKWVAFHSLHNPAGLTRVWVAPVHDDRPAAQTEWIAISAGEARDLSPAWGATGSLLYFFSDRDGFRCIWARRLDPHTKQPAGEAIAVRHFHSARFSLQYTGYVPSLSAAAHQLVFALTELTGNIWLMEPPPDPR